MEGGAVGHCGGEVGDARRCALGFLRLGPGSPRDPATGDCSKFDFLVLGGASGVPGAQIPGHHGPISKDPANPFFPCQGTFDRKIRELVTLDMIVNYTFNLPPPAAQNEVAGYAKDGGKNVKMSGKDKNVRPLSTAQANPCGWRSMLNNVTITLGVDNVTDEQPPFVAAAF